MTTTKWTPEQVLFVHQNKNKRPRLEWLTEFIERWPELAEEVLCTNAKVIQPNSNEQWLRFADILLALDCKADRFNCVFKSAKATSILGAYQNGNELLIPLSGLRAFAKEYPRFFRRYDIKTLSTLFNSRRFATEIKKEFSRPLTNHIICVETGQIWPSRTAAARDLFISRSHLGKMINEGGEVKALRLTFKALDTAPIQT